MPVQNHSLRVQGIKKEILAKAVGVQVLGKSPAGMYLRLNQWIWERLPLRCAICIPSVPTGHGCMPWFVSSPGVSSIRPIFSTKSFVAGVDAPPGRAEVPRRDVKNCPAGVQHRSRGLFDPLDHSFGPAGLESAPGCGGYFAGNIDLAEKVITLPIPPSWSVLRFSNR